MLRYILCGLLLFAFVPRGRGDEIVVATRHPAASDKNPGTPALPLKTISAAAAKVKAGDHVIIHGGDYREVVIITASGTADAPITFEAAANETPVIKGSDLLTNWQHDEGEVWKAKLPSFPPHSEDGKMPAYWNTHSVRQVFAQDGLLLEARRLQRVLSRSEMKPGMFFCDEAAITLYVWLEDSRSPALSSPEVSVRCAWLYITGSNIVIRGLAMRHASTTAIANWPACSLNGENITMEDCFLSWGDFVGISLSGKANRLLRTTVACNGDCGAGGTGENHLIEGCHFLFNNIDRYNTAWHAGGAKLIPNFKHSTVRHNEFAHNLGPGLWLDGQCDENVIDGNFAHDNEGAGIMVEISTGNLVMNNVSITNRNVLSGPYRTAEGNEQTIRSSEQGIAPSRLLKPYHAGDGRGIYISSAPKTKVLHNTVYMNQAEGICVEGPPRNDGTFEVETKGSLVRNNISVFNQGSQLTLRPSTEGRVEPSGLSDCNLLFSVGAVFARTGWDGVSSFELKQWQTISGQDQHSLDADPQFAMAAMDDFRLLKGSPGLAKGNPLAEVNHDYFGHARGQTTTDLGAFEGAAELYPRPIWPGGTSGTH